jgi:two-component system, chemotaxis family, chemotaxis protein CheY
MVSAYAELWRVREARDAGCNEFVVKPFAARTLYAKIRTIVENPRPFVEVPDGYFGPDRRRRNTPVQEERRKAGGQK